MLIQKIDNKNNNVIFQGVENKEKNFLKGLVCCTGFGLTAPLWGFLDGDSFKEVKKNFNIKNCAKYAAVGAVLYTGYKGIDTFVKAKNKKEEKIKTGIYSLFGAISFPLISKFIMDNSKKVNDKPFSKTLTGKNILLFSGMLGIILPWIETKKFD